MNYLVAVLSFSAIMIVLATLATVIVEAFHKVIGMRAANFNEMLVKLYQDVVVPKVSKEIEDSEPLLVNATDEFVNAVVRNPAIQRIGLLRRLWGVRRFFKTKYATDFDRLTTRQFVEQFRNTNAAKVIRTTSEEKAKEIINCIAYEFERYGQSTRTYFERNAAALAMAVSLLLTVTLNVDAIRLYTGLAKDSAMSKKVIASINVEELQSAYQERVSKGQAGVAKIEFDNIKKEIREDIAEIEALELPLGAEYFPYCRKTEVDSSSEAAKFKDARCSDFVITRYYDFWKFEGGNRVSRYLNGVIDNVEAFFYGVLAVLLSSDGWLWILRCLLTGALIGLGVPFWYKTYSFVAQFVPGRSAPVNESLQSRRVNEMDSTPTPVTVVIQNGDTKSGPVYLSETLEKRDNQRARSFEINQDNDLEEQRTVGSKVKQSDANRQTTFDANASLGLSDNDVYDIFTSGKL